MANAASNKAAENVWQVAELLEEILLRLPLHDLLVSQRVCRTWHTGTSSILEALFLQPRPGRCTYRSTGRNPGWKNLDGDAVSPVYNPFISKDFVFIPDLDADEMLAALPYGGEIIHYGLVAPDPFIKKHQQLYQQVNFLGMGASWRNMLVMQPPATQIEFDCDNHWYEVTGNISTTISNPNGVTWGDLVDAYRAHWMQCLNCPIWGTPELDGPARWPVNGGRELRVMDIGTGMDSLNRIKDMGIDVAAEARSKDEDEDPEEDEESEDDDELDGDDTE
ncbi:uncharacterized protein CLAFUR5_10484 [Fulvia fulva]|uniref:F-box domain-containing protein n=1 Tax=Passalora fulva TaxID=5499 RepID=A0A9Q8PC12_PASFU|nr:uncharacterized protein CLAFUR5_10484 [Fulvia fulva]KAK4621126.1 hypothetical protein CLAFUR0_11456 [Fulvia fulva]UJO19665.1 hypothetical protein CLAFUR5_10484 [Fulvia fulva]